jgi:uncharacterized membrane protein (Fun14 family)
LKNTSKIELVSDQSEKMSTTIYPTIEEEISKETLKSIEKDSQIIENIKDDEIEIIEKTVKAVKAASSIADKVANAKAAQCLIGAVLGYFTGYFTKKIGKNVLMMVGGGSLAIASLNHFNYIQVDTEKIKKDLDPLIEQGKKANIQKYFKIAKEYVKQNVFVAISFAIGGLIAL